MDPRWTGRHPPRHQPRTRMAEVKSGIAIGMRPLSPDLRSSSLWRSSRIESTARMLPSESRKKAERVPWDSSTTWLAAWLRFYKTSSDLPRVVDQGASGHDLPRRYSRAHRDERMRGR